MVNIIGTFSEAKLAVIDFAVQMIRTSERALNDDGGAAPYQRATGTLEPMQQDYSWFKAGDESLWQISTGQQVFAAQFGARGGNQIDSTPIIQAALDAPMVDVLNLGSLFTGRYAFSDRMC